MQRGVDRRLRGLLARGLGEPTTDLLEREGVVAQKVAVRFDERERRLGRLVVALDRRGLAMAGDPVMRDRDVDDVRNIGGLARDDERLGKTKLDDPRTDLHESAAYWAAIETT